MQQVIGSIRLGDGGRAEPSPSRAIAHATRTWRCVRLTSSVPYQVVERFRLPHRLGDNSRIPRLAACTSRIHRAGCTPRLTNFARPDIPANDSNSHHHESPVESEQYDPRVSEISPQARLCPG